MVFRPARRSRQGRPQPGSLNRPAATTSERREAERREQHRKKRRLIRIGQALMVVGAVVGLIHLFAHLGVFGGQPPGIVDVLVGYPAAGLLMVAGAITAGQ